MPASSCDCSTDLNWDSVYLEIKVPRMELLDHVSLAKPGAEMHEGMSRCVVRTSVTNSLGAGGLGKPVFHQPRHCSGNARIIIMTGAKITDSM